MRDPAHARASVTYLGSVPSVRIYRSSCLVPGQRFCTQRGEKQAMSGSVGPPISDKQDQTRNFLTIPSRRGTSVRSGHDLPERTADPLARSDVTVAGGQQGERLALRLARRRRTAGLAAERGRDRFAGRAVPHPDVGIGAQDDRVARRADVAGGDELADAQRRASSAPGADPARRAASCRRAKCRPPPSSPRRAASRPGRPSAPRRRARRPGSAT